MALAVAGLVCLVSPGLASPPPGGAALLAETIDLRLALSSAVILGGIALVLTARAHRG